VTLLEIMFAMGALAMVMIGVVITRCWSAPAGAVIGLLPFTLAVLGPIADAVIARRERRRSWPARAIVVRRRAS